MTQKVIVLTTGGSGGHVFPAQSVATELLKKKHTIIFITDNRGNAFQNMPEVKTYHLMAESVTGRSIVGKMIAAIKLCLGSWQAMWLLHKIKPDLVIGFGGYASIPTVFSAEMLGIPVVLHEQNAILGRANRFVAKRAKLVATSFPSVQQVPGAVPTLHVGQPVRAPILEKANTPFDEGKDFNLLIFGGSQGARFFSRKLPDALMKLDPTLRKKIVLTQQARPEDEEALRKKYANAGFKKLVIQPFFKNMPELLSAAHLVIGRGGAGTLTEVMVVGRPAVIIPLPTAADNHQYANAKVLENAGGAIVIQEKDFDADKLAEQLTQMIQQPATLTKMAKNAHKLAILNAAGRMAEVVVDVAEGNKK